MRGRQGAAELEAAAAADRAAAERARRELQQAEALVWDKDQALRDAAAEVLRPGPIRSDTGRPGPAHPARSDATRTLAGPTRSGPAFVWGNTDRALGDAAAEVPARPDPIRHRPHRPARAVRARAGSDGSGGCRWASSGGVCGGEGGVSREPARACPLTRPKFGPAPFARSP